MHLVSLSGKNKGVSWVLGPRSIVVGRSADCDIVLTDGLASRHQCRISYQDHQVRLDDLGARNPVLVNGVPASNRPLEIGDELAVGGERFLVVGPQDGLERLDPNLTSAETWTLRSGDPVLARIDSEAPPPEEHPGTIRDYIFLYDVVRQLCDARSIVDFMTVLQSQVTERFKPLRLWIAKVDGPDDVPLFLGEDSTVPPPMNAMRKALEARQALIMRESDRREGRKVQVLTLVCPIILAGTPIAGLVLQTEYPHGAFDEDDLRLVVFLARLVAPILNSVENDEQLRRERDRLRARAGESLEFIGTSRVAQRVRSLIIKAARSDMGVLVTGETGTGKELVARLVHAGSSRGPKPFVVVNCAAIPRELFESQMFGHEAGAYTGASEFSPGFMAEAHGGTLFLDEVGDLSLENQARILRAVEYGSFRRLGAAADTHVDIRIIAATNKNLATGISNGTFRSDLFHRLSELEIPVPPLRDRPSDIPVLANHFLDMAKNQGKRPITGFHPDALEYLAKRRWPGNARELRNRIFRAVLMTRGSIIGVRDISATATEPDALAPDDSILSMAEMEKRHIASVLRLCDGNVSEAARLLQVARSTLYDKIADYGIKGS